MMHTLFRVALGLSLGCLVAGWPGLGAQAPGWEDAPALTTPAAELLQAADRVPPRPGYEGVFLLDECHVSLDEAGRRTVRLHRVYRLDQEAGLLSQMTSVRSTWAGWFEERPVIRGRVITPDRVEHPLDPATVGDFQTQVQDPDLLSDRKEVRAPLPAVGRGAVVEVEVLLKESRPFSRAGARGSFEFGALLPAQRLRFGLDAPEAAHLQWLARGLGPGAVQRTVAGGRVQYRVEAGPTVPPAAREPFQAWDQEDPPYVVYSTTPSWNAVAREYLELAEAQMAGADLRAWAQSAVAGAGDRNEKIDRLLQKLRRSVRYTGLEFRDASIVPRTPEEVLKRGYGDCKDQACLLVALLRTQGIPAQVALLRAGAMPPFQAEVPGLEVFNHAIVYLPGAHPLWIDPSAPHSRAGALPGADQGRPALVVAAGTRGLVSTPQDSAEQDSLRKDFDVVMGDAGLARVGVAFTATGSAEIRLRDAFAGADPAHLSDPLRAQLIQAGLGKDLGKVEWQDPDDLLHPFRATAQAVDSSYASTGPMDAWVALNPWPLLANFESLIQGANGERPAGTTPAPASGAGAPRRTDLQLPELYGLACHWVVHAPDGFSHGRLPENRSVPFGPARLVCRYGTTPAGEVAVDYRFECGRLRWSPREVMEARRALAALKLEQVPVIAYQPTGMADLNAGRCQEGLAELRKSAAAHPDRAAPLLRLSRAQLMAGLGDSARASARKALELEPDSPRACEGLGWALASDSLGRIFGLGWDRPGAIAANRRAIALDPRSRTARWQLASVLERDPLGGRLTGGADLDEAITLYQALADEEKNENLSSSLVIALACRGRFREARSLVVPMRGSPKWNGWLVALNACAEGLPAALAQAERDLPDPATRWQAFLAAGDICCQFRHFSEASGLLEAGAPGSDQATQVRDRAQILAKVRPFDPGRRPAKDPKNVPIRFLAQILSASFDPVKVRNTVARGVRTELEQPEMLRLRRHYLGAPLSSGKPAEGALDILDSLYETSVDGTDALGYVVWQQFQGTKEIWFVAAEEGGYRLVGGMDGHGYAFGRQASRLLERGDVHGAGVWLDWAESALPKGGAQDPLSGPPFKVVRAGAGGGAAALRLEAACLKAFGPLDDSTVQPLQDAFRDTPAGNPRGAFGIALANALHRQGDWAALESLTDSLSSQFPDSPTVQAWRFRALDGRRHWQAMLDLADRALAGRPEDTGLLLERVRALAGLHRFAEAERVIAALTASDRMTAGDWNDLAWIQVDTGWISPRTLDFARRATRDAKNQTEDAMHTLAAVLAELGRTTEAREALLRSMDLDGTDQPRSKDWFVLGRIAEHLDDPAAALGCYARLNGEPSMGSLAKSVCRLLAQSRVQALASSTPAAR